MRHVGGVAQMKRPPPLCHTSPPHVDRGAAHGRSVTYPAVAKSPSFDLQTSTLDFPWPPVLAAKEHSRSCGRPLPECLNRRRPTAASNRSDWQAGRWHRPVSGWFDEVGPSSKQRGLRPGPRSFSCRQKDRIMETQSGTKELVEQTKKTAAATEAAREAAEAARSATAASRVMPPGPKAAIRIIEAQDIDAILSKLDAPDRAREPRAVYPTSGQCSEPSQLQRVPQFPTASPAWTARAGHGVTEPRLRQATHVEGLTAPAADLASSLNPPPSRPQAPGPATRGCRARP